MAIDFYNFFALNYFLPNDFVVKKYCATERTQDVFLETRKISWFFQLFFVKIVELLWLRWHNRPLSRQHLQHKSLFHMPLNILVEPSHFYKKCPINNSLGSISQISRSTLGTGKNETAVSFPRFHRMYSIRESLSWLTNDCDYTSLMSVLLKTIDKNWPGQA